MTNWTVCTISFVIGCVIGFVLNCFGINLWDFCRRSIKRTNKPIITRDMQMQRMRKKLLEEMKLLEEKRNREYQPNAAHAEKITGHEEEIIRDCNEDQ